MACKDKKIVDNIVQDDDRLSYLKRHLTAARQAINKGAKLVGYYVWSLMDNLEWVAGFSRRFGLIHVNFDTQERIWKKSARWYAAAIRYNSFETD